MATSKSPCASRLNWMCWQEPKGRDNLDRYMKSKRVDKMFLAKAGPMATWLRFERSAAKADMNNLGTRHRRMEVRSVTAS
ncbi:MAG: hypothetical protein AMXMBFR84_47360 [Candidatus Hydrogenedentota bacterium]